MEEPWSSGTESESGSDTEGGGGGGGGRRERLSYLAERASSLLALLEEGTKRSEEEEEHVAHVVRQLRGRIRAELRGGQSIWRQVVTGRKDKSVREHLRERRREAHVVRLIDKISFAGGVLLLVATEGVLLLRPWLFWRCYCLVIPALVLVRFLAYRAAGGLYFLMDFCYFGNVMCLVALLLFPRSSTLFHVVFLFAAGPLSWAIVAWRNSLVFHSLDKITSLFIHAFPALLLFCLRWFPTPGHVGEDPRHVDPGQWARAMGLALFFYLFWQVAYFLKTELLDREILEGDPTLQTSLRHMARDSRNVLHVAVLRAVRALGLFGPEEPFDPSSAKTKLVFMAAQLLFTVASFLPAPLLYRSFSLHLAFLLALFAASVYNGAGYYIEVFSQQYSSKFAPPKKVPG